MSSSHVYRGKVSPLSVESIGSEADRQKDLAEGINPEWPDWRKNLARAMNNPEEGRQPLVKEETPIGADTTEDIARDIVGKDEGGLVPENEQEPTPVPSFIPDEEQVDTGKPGVGTVLGAGMVGMGKEAQPAPEQNTADMARDVVGEDENKPVSADSQRPVTIDNFSRPGKKNQSNISEQEIAKALNMENLPGQDGSVGGKIKEDETPRSPGGGMGSL